MYSNMASGSWGPSTQYRGLARPWLVPTHHRKSGAGDQGPSVSYVEIKKSLWHLSLFL